MSILARILISATTLVSPWLPQPVISAEFRKSILGPSALDVIEVVHLEKPLDLIVHLGDVYFSAGEAEILRHAVDKAALLQFGKGALRSPPRDVAPFGSSANRKSQSAVEPDNWSPGWLQHSRRLSLG